MARRKVVLADASPLIGLARIGGLAWLRRLYREIHVTPAVRREISARRRPGAAALSAALRAGWIRRAPPAPRGPLLPRLGEGEASTLRAAISLGDQALVILDDFAARREARRLGVAFVGTAGVVVAARRAGLIGRARPVFERLAEEGFHLSAELVEAVLSELGER